MNIIFDLDGTLLNSKNRLYALFNTLCPVSNLTFDEYWLLKHQGVSNQEILSHQFSYSETEVIEFTIKWMRLIESNYFLDMDYLFHNAKRLLCTLSQKHKLFLCTARQNEQFVIEQLKKFEILHLFEKVLVTQRKKSKTELVKESGVIINNQDWFVGDTGEDIKVGKALELRTCAVTYGFLSKDTLMKYNPDIILDSISELLLYFK